MLWAAAFAAVAWSAFAGGIAGEDAKARVRAGAGAGAERPPARPVDVRGSGIPGTVFFHGADGMVIRTTVPGTAGTPAHGAAAPVHRAASPQPTGAAAANPQATVGGGFKPEE